MATRIMKCLCYHEYQDKIYGKNMRIFNMKGDGERWTCTVCRNEVYRAKRKSKEETF